MQPRPAIASRLAGLFLPAPHQSATIARCLGSLGRTNLVDGSLGTSGMLPPEAVRVSARFAFGVIMGRQTHSYRLGCLLAGHPTTPLMLRTRRHHYMPTQAITCETRWACHHTTTQTCRNASNWHRTIRRHQRGRRPLCASCGMSALRDTMFPHGQPEATRWFAPATMDGLGAVV
jgi:hypothetical protein